MLLDLITSAIKPLPHKPVKLDQRVTIGMAAHGNAAITNLALDYLFSSTRGDYELILVDDASPDDSLKVFLEKRRFHKNAKIFSFPKNLEYCESVNAIMSHAAGEYVFFISNDIYVTPTYLRELVDCLRDNSGYGIARGCSNFVDNNLQPHNLLNSNYRFDSKPELFKFSEALATVNEDRVPLDDPFLTGDAFAVRRKVIDRIGGIDTRFIGYFGDIDFAIRCRAAGFRNVITTKAFAYHNASSNFNYLDHEERNNKIKRRFQRVHAAYREFLRKYAIDEVNAPNDLGPLNVAGEDFQRALFLAGRKAESDPQLIYVSPKDYGRYLVK